MARTAAPISPADLKRQLVNSVRKIKQYPGIDNYQPHEMQLAFHSSEAKGKLFMGGNRAGKTVGGAAEMVMRLTGKHPYREGLPRAPIRARGVAVDFDRGVKQIMIPEIAKWVPMSELINGSWEDSYSKTDRVLTLENGSSLEFMSYEQDVGKFQGTSRHCIWFDEEPPEDIFKECMARLIDTDGDWWMTMTPLIEMSWTYNQLYEPASRKILSDIDLFEANTKDNPHINMTAFERLTQTMSEEEKKTRGSGVYISHTGLVYGESFTRTRNIIPDIRKSSRFKILRESWSHFQMMDHGYNNPTAWLFAAYDNDGRIIIYDEIYETKKLVSELAEMVKDKRAELAINTGYAVGDPSIKSTNPVTGGSVQSEYGENGIYIALGNNDVQSGITRTQAMFSEQQLLITENCENLLAEIYKYKWDRHLTKIKDRKNKKEEPLKKDDHAMDAMRYGVMSRPKQYSNVEEPREQLIMAAPVATDFDWELIEKRDRIFDSVLGSEY